MNELKTKKPKTLVFRIIIPLLIILIAMIGSKQFSKLKSPPPMAEKKDSEALPVMIKKIEAKSFPIQLSGFGTLKATEELSIIPQVNGLISETHPQLEAGLSIQKGEVLFKIEPNEYEFRLGNEKANLARAEFELKEEEGKRLVAQREWALLDYNIKKSGISKDLALRKAHAIQKTAAVEAAKSNLKLAQLNLQRTQIKSPCNGVILNEQIAIGQYVSLGNPVASVACIDRLQLITSLPPTDIRWLTPFQTTREQANATVMGYPAKLVRLLPNVAAETKMIQVVFELTPNVLQQSKETEPKEADRHQANQYPLLLGQFVTVNFSGNTVKNAFKMPEEYLRSNNEIWIMRDNKLAIHKIDILSRYENEVIFQFKKEQNKNMPLHLNLVTSYINSPYLGMPLQSIPTKFHSNKGNTL